MDIEPNIIQLPPVNEKRGRLFKKILIITGATIGFGAILFFVLPYVFGVFTSDISPKDDSDLIVDLSPPVPIPDSENAFLEIDQISKLRVTKYDDNLVQSYLLGKTWDEAYVEELIKENGQTFKLLDTASKKLKFQTPIREYIWNPAVFRQNIELASLRAIYLSKHGSGKEAVEEIFKLLDIGQKIHDYKRQGFTDFLVGEMTKRIGLETLQRLLIESGNLSSEDLRAYALKLDGLMPDKTGLNNYYKDLYTRTATTIDALAIGDTDKLRELYPGEEFMGEFGLYGGYGTIASKKESFYFRPNESKALEASLIRTVLNDINSPCSSSPSGPSLLDKYKESLIDATLLKSPIIFYFTENALGKLGHYAFTSSFIAGGTTSTCDEEMLAGVTKTALFVKAYKIDNGALPNDLDKLIPTYVSELPKDPYSGATFKYSPEKKIIYSVGSDRKDSGGSVGDDWRNMDDPTFKIEF